MKKILVYFLYTFIFSLNCSSLHKPWTVLIYIAGDNDLEIFIDTNLQDMMKIGSNENCNIIVCIARREGNKRTKTLKYVLIEHQKQILLYEKKAPSVMDSGQEETLRAFCMYGIENFPATHYGLIFWDHGTGPLEPTRHISYRTHDIFKLNSHFSLRPCILPALTLLLKPHLPTKAVCFDDTSGNYLTEKKILQTLNALYTTTLKGKKFAFIGFDTCLMANVEIASFLKSYSNYMIASQEVELGTGWNYEKVFSIFTNRNPSPLEVGHHIIHSYKTSYSFADDLTLSCVDLEKYTNAEKHLAELIQFLHTTHQTHPGLFLKSLLKTSAHKKNCTHFDEPEYIDIIHFLENLLYNFQKASIKKEGTIAITLKAKAKKLIRLTIKALQEAIVANTAGKYFTKATGLSIYFPTHIVDKFYKKNTFCCATHWAQLLQSCL